MTTGVVVGKFYPPHNGHHHLIDTALRGCDKLVVMVVDNPEYIIPTARRREWLVARHPGVDIRIISDIYVDDDSEAWAKHTISFLGYAPDIVFSSENYGITWAECMNAKHVMVDIDRTTFPVSGTKVRNDKYAMRNYLSPAVRTDLTTRVVIVGAESTGTTTLANDLSQALSVEVVPEIGRYYTESIKHSGRPWNNNDFVSIASLQQSYEKEIAARSDGLIVCDTNATATVQWQRRYMGASTLPVVSIANRDRADLYIITGDEIPFVQDGIRDGEHIRHDMHQWFIDAVDRSGAPFIVVTGDKTERLESALDFIEAHSEITNQFWPKPNVVSTVH